MYRDISTSQGGTTNNASYTSVTSLGTQSGQFPNIEDFLYDAYLHSVNKLGSPAKIEFVKNFYSYINNLHCIENLQFLISCIQYESTYSKVLLRIPKYSSRKDSVATVTTITTNDNLPTNYFASTIEDLEESQEICWNDFEEHMLLSSDESEDDESSVSSSKNTAASTLAKQWHHIVDSFVNHDSKLQVNLSDNSYKMIMNSTEEIPEPSVLAPAKAEIIRLLNENVYHPYIKKTKLCDKFPCEDCTCELAQSRPASPAPKSFKNSPVLSPFKFSRPTSPISISSSLLSPTNSNFGSSKKKSTNSHPNGSLTSFFGHLKLHNKNSNSSLASSATNCSPNANSNFETTPLSTSPVDDSKRFKLFSKKSKV